MTDLTDEGRRRLGEIAARHRLPTGVVEEMARAIARGGGTMAQFNIPELGGWGQWMSGGMTMVGDMFNHGLKAQVDGLCAELSAAMDASRFFHAPQTMAGSAWWPQELGRPASSGGQNTVRYAYFPDVQRIAFDPGNGAPVILLDALDHQIGGFGQQQSEPGDPFAGITFSSQHGQFALSTLPQAALGGAAAAEPSGPAHEPTAEPTRSAPAEPTPSVAPVERAAPAAYAVAPAPAAAPAAATAPPPAMAGSAGQDILATIERLAALRDAGVLTDEEFANKKTELLSRL